MVNWIKNRVMERTSWDGGAMIAVGLVVLFLGPFAKYAAMAAIAWGVLTMLKSETNIMAELETEVKLLKKELQDQKKIHDRMDVAIEKLTDVSNSIHRMLAVHEEKIARQEEATLQADAKLEIRRTELTAKIDELHSRITTNTKEIMTAAAQQHTQQNKEIQKIKDELAARVGVLEKWRHVLIGSSIVAGFILHKMVNLT